MLFFLSKVKCPTSLRSIFLSSAATLTSSIHVLRGLPLFFLSESSKTCLANLSGIRRSTKSTTKLQQPRDRSPGQVLRRPNRENYTMLSRNTSLAIHTKVIIYLLFLRTLVTYAAPDHLSFFSRPPTKVSWSDSNPDPSFPLRIPMVCQKWRCSTGYPVSFLTTFIQALVISSFSKAEESTYPHLRILGIAWRSL